MNERDRELYEALQRRLDDLAANYRVLNDGHLDTQVRLTRIETQLATLAKVVTVGLSAIGVIVTAVGFALTYYRFFV